MTPPLMSSETRMKYAALCALVVLAGCESERTIATKAKPQGEVVPCVGLSEKGKRAGIDYDLSGRNLFWGIVGAEFIYPPIKVAISEIYCPIRDTSTVKP